MADYKSEILKVQKEIESEWSFHYQKVYSRICLKMDKSTMSI